MSATEKPLWWLDGEVWHEDPLVDIAGTPLTEAAAWDFIYKTRPGGGYVWRRCDPGGGSAIPTNEVRIRRTAPPVADQCKLCRAAKAKERKMRT